ncbi:helix-turn-helix transcriptional regulator [Streptomyces sp. B29(2018)]|uniref:helix-turn-helix transcriptional regulator n=1 Tax=Streptomyces sp. B29(2018) TaxID=2485016 RepID=UPI0013E38ACB|nr:helix-turn-helix transcriptional regulator [Streptomyces sp. B29(2018)]
MGDTTLRLAGVLARLTECRPSVGNLAKWLELSPRTIKYHLGLLRETGLLAYRSKGTRVRGIGGRASEFMRTIPAAFDDSTGLKTAPSSTLIRRVVSFGDQQTGLLKKLYAAARRQIAIARKSGARGRRRTSTPSCTPSVASTSRSSSAGTPFFPPESKLVSGKSTSPISQQRSSRRLNIVGRRYRLATQLVRRVGWLHRASVARTAWIVRNVSDAGWTATEVIALLSMEAPAQRIHRPTGFLANRLKYASQLYDTPEKRRTLVTWWEHSRRAERERHTDWDGAWQRPTSIAVTRDVEYAVAQLRHHRHFGTPPTSDTSSRLPLDIDGLSREQVIDLRVAALKDPALVRGAVLTRGELFARRLYTSELVDQVYRLQHLNRTVVHRWSA